MVTRPKKRNASEKKKGKVSKLKLNKETVKDLTAGEMKGIVGGAAAFTHYVGCSAHCPR